MIIFPIVFQWWCLQRWQICRGCRWYRRQFATGVVDTGGKFVTGINNTSKTGGEICHRCRWLTCEYIRKFSKKFETVLMEYSGAGGKLIHEKNQKQKISLHGPFKLRPLRKPSYKLTNYCVLWEFQTLLSSSGFQSFPVSESTTSLQYASLFPNSAFSVGFKICTV